jgi:hypothetical protein
MRGSVPLLKTIGDAHVPISFALCKTDPGHGSGPKTAYSDSECCERRAHRYMVAQSLERL